jgi:hypothetical protein
MRWRSPAHGLDSMATIGCRAYVFSAHHTHTRHLWHAAPYGNCRQRAFVIFMTVIRDAPET